jgi:phytanoyl-CoA hydroxylase
MSLIDSPFSLSPEQVEAFERDGFLAVRGLFSLPEIEQLREHFMALQREALEAESPLRQFYAPLSAREANGDILKQFPRVMHPHRFDELSKQTMLDARLRTVLGQLFGEEPLASQSMFYYKPAGAKGQALHQDNFYLNVKPGTCIAAWVSIDDSDAENGGMFVVPGSHREGLQCPHLADMSQSFSTEEVSVPSGLEAIQVPLKAGDILFFNGSMIHGSTPNSSEHRFRRAFICHYVGNSMTGMNGGYYPLHSFDGEIIERERYGGDNHTCGSEDWETFQKLRANWAKDHAIASGLGMSLH